MFTPYSSNHINLMCHKRQRVVDAVDVGSIGTHRQTDVFEFWIIFNLEAKTNHSNRKTIPSDANR